MELRVLTPLLVLLCTTPIPIQAAQPQFRVCSYNVEAYLDAPTQGRQPKLPAARAKVQESLLAAQADVVALQEMGSLSALAQLRAALRAAGLDYPYWDHVTGYDTNIHLAILSRFPIVARRPHTNDSFLLYGRRYRVSRGFAEVDIQVTPKYRFTLLSAHLKSRRSVSYADESELREEEARVLRRLITRKLTRTPERNLVVLGDFNDTKDSPSLRLILGRGKSALVDTRPAETPNQSFNPGRSRSRSDPPDRPITWTYFYHVQDVYSRIDYVLVSRGMLRELAQSRIVMVPDWGAGSDHRPLVATFRAQDQ